ncbi:MAG: hypothetical protein E7378_01355 [Clostridiales bacterium]|nr:hypothetical protein [Clostridiales bacterium]
MKLITELKLNLNYNQDDIYSAICKKTKLNKKDIHSFEIIKLGIDARKKPDVKYVLNVAISVDKKCEAKLKNFEDIIPDHAGLQYDKSSTNIPSPVVVGFGPSGMFCALALAMAGLKPIVLEQGKAVDERIKDIESFWKNGILNERSNVQFGEGGAGTFSDGKLNTTLNNPYCKKVVNEFILNGAPKEIYYKNKAHIGTDNLRNIVKNIRNKIISLGGQVLFNAKFEGFETKDNQIQSVKYFDIATNQLKTLKTNNLILAIGHSAIKTFEYLKYQNVQMRHKPFAMGVRIQHPQPLINKAQYGIENSPYLPSADYKIVEHLPSGRNVFSFCMCPGGEIVASSSENGTIVTNGMSNFARDGKFANSALLVNVEPSDFDGEDVLAGLYYQRKFEKLAYEIAGKNYNAPATTVGDFLNKENSQTANDFEHKNAFVNKQSTYKPAVTFCDISKCLPNFATDSLKQALPLFDKKIKGFANANNILIAPETRSSCPIQFIRSENYECTYNGLFACGEGAGYAGGIISSAVDGVKCAEKIIKRA